MEKPGLWKKTRAMEKNPGYEKTRVFKTRVMRKPCYEKPCYEKSVYEKIWGLEDNKFIA